jgi:1-phosphatidylinositol phosphodiesterase
MKIIFTYLCALLVYSSSLLAHTDGAYYHDNKNLASQKDWMKKLPNSRHLSKISMPGTHDTASFHGGDITQTQSLSITQQLEAGIRFLDIRIKHEKNIFDIYHGIQYQHATFDKVLDEVTNFLKNNPSEVVLMRVSQAGKETNNTRSFSDTYKDYISKYQNFFAYPNQNFDPLLCQIRGKILLYPTDNIPLLKEWGLDYHTAFDAQDDYHLVSNWDLYSKWEKIRSHLNKSNQNKTSKKIFLNYLSGSGGSFPYFVASGHSSPGTDAPRLSTGIVSTSKDKYPDFPRVACLGNLCTTAFEGTNTLTKDYLKANKLSYVGIVIADFPGQELIDAIIKINSFKVDAALGDKEGACLSLLHFKSSGPIACEKLKSNDTKILLEKPAAQWAENDRNKALTIINNIIRTRAEAKAKWSNADIQSVLKLDCNAIKQDANYPKLTSIPAHTWSDNERNTAIVVIMKGVNLPVGLLQALTNTELAEFFRSF